MKPIDSPISSRRDPAHLGDLEEPERPGDRPAHEDVAPQRQLLGERALLEDGLHAQRAGPLDVEAVHLPARRTGSRPPSGWCTPVMILIRVDLPAPLSPSSPSTSPATSREAHVVEHADARRTTCGCGAARGAASPRPPSAVTGSAWHGLERPASERSRAGRRVARARRRPGISGSAAPRAARSASMLSGVDEAAARVDEQAAEAVVVRQAELLDRHEALQPLLLVDDEVDEPVLDTLHGRGRQVEPGHVEVVGRRGRRPPCRSGSSRSGCRGR